MYMYIYSTIWWVWPLFIILTTGHIYANYRAVRCVVYNIFNYEVHIYICVYICMYIYMHMYVHIHANMCNNIYMCACISVCFLKSIYIYIYLYAFFA